MEMRNFIKAAMIGVPILLSGCASIVSGTTDNITVNSDPQGAKCDLKNGEITVANVESTPATVLVRRKADDLIVRCSKEGYLNGSSVNNSGLNGWVFGNVAFGGIIGVIIDSSDGAMFDYDSTTMVSLTPVPAQSPLNVEQVINE